MYLFHLVLVAAGVRWTLELNSQTAADSDFACTVDEETRGFAEDITRAVHQRMRAP